MEGSHPYPGKMDRDEVRCPHLSLLGLPGGFFLPEIRGISAPDFCYHGTRVFISGCIRSREHSDFRLLIDVLELKLGLVPNDARSGSCGRICWSA